MSAASFMRGEKTKRNDWMVAECGCRQADQTVERGAAEAHSAAADLARHLETTLCPFIEKQ